MNSYRETESKFSLKDELFSKEKVTEFADRITAVYPDFKNKVFISRVVGKFAQLELKERIEWIVHNLDHYVPMDYKKQLKVLLASLPPKLDQQLQDDDFGEFINVSYSHFVAVKGCSREHIKESLKALKEITKRFSAEFSIRFFINKFPQETMEFLIKCSKDKNYHVRRLASEGSRPKLPWAQKILINHEEPLVILDTLFRDKTRYVTRSVANHLNDISKIDPQLVISVIKRWDREVAVGNRELEFIKTHALRSLVNKGDVQALKLLGYRKPQIIIKGFLIENKEIGIGDSSEFSFTICSTKKETQELLIDYVVSFLKKNGSYATKTFKIKKLQIHARECLVLSKRHSFKSMSTKTLYPGVHKIQLQINGELYNKGEFILK